LNSGAQVKAKSQAQAQAQAESQAKSQSQAQAQAENRAQLVAGAGAGAGAGAEVEVETNTAVRAKTEAKTAAVAKGKAKAKATATATTKSKMDSLIKMKINKSGTRCGLSVCEDGSQPKDVGCDPLTVSSATMQTATALNTIGPPASSCCSSLCSCLSGTSDTSCFAQFHACLKARTCAGNPDDCYALNELVYTAALGLGCSGWDRARCPPIPPTPPSQGVPEVPPPPYVKKVSVVVSKAAPPPPEPSMAVSLQLSFITSCILILINFIL